MNETEIVKPGEIREVWERGRRQWVEWCATQAWRSDPVGDLARRVIDQEEPE